MKLLRVGAAVLNQTPLEWDENRDRILAVLEQARARGVSLLCLPELCVTGYGCEDAFLSSGVQARAWELLYELAPACRGMVVALGLPVSYQNALYNCAALVVDGEVAGFVAKRSLCGDGVHYEPRWFKAWPAGVQEEVERDGGRYPIGDLHFDCGGVKVGFEICEDAWVSDRPGSRLARRGVDVILNPSASHFALGKLDIRKRFVIEGSRSFGVSYVYSNLVGNEAGRIVYDGGALIATQGRMLAQGPRFEFAEIGLTDAVVDVDATRRDRSRLTSFQPVMDGTEHDRVRAPFVFPEIEPEPSVPSPPTWEASSARRHEEFTRAEALALLDYMRKSRTHGFVVSLSGGADSAAVAALVTLALRLAVAELGLEGFRERFAHVPAVASCEKSAELVRALLLCVYQATQNSGEVTRSAAREVAAALGADFLELDVDPLVHGYTSMIEAAVGRELDWERDDATLQNIQARVRGPGVWMLANIRRALLLATSNRSEAAVGYATMDGDTCGGLSPVAGVDKAFLREWLAWLEVEGPEGQAPVPALRVVNEQQPTAELRPPEVGQTDEDDLMPYPLLEEIESAAIGEQLSPRDVFRLVRTQFPQYPDDALRGWVERFFRLWCINQWKRERYAPAFHLDDKNLDPRSWCRFPILSGAFRRELEELGEEPDRSGPAPAPGGRSAP